MIYRSRTFDGRCLSPRTLITACSDAPSEGPCLFWRLTRSREIWASQCIRARLCDSRVLSDHVVVIYASTRNYPPDCVVQSNKANHRTSCRLKSEPNKTWIFKISTPRSTIELLLLVCALSSQKSSIGITRMQH